MTLFKQVSLVLLFIFTILFILITAVTFKIIKDSTEKSLYENVQNSATSISLSITNAGSDLSSIKTVMNASFDNGNYEKIIFKDIDGNIVYELKKEMVLDENVIPSWFIKFINIGEISAKATISNGWNVLGNIEIYNDRTISYNQIYSIFNNLIFSLFVSFILLLIILFYLFKYILKPLIIIKKQADAVMRNEFIMQNDLPFTSEFKSVTLSINSMIAKIEKMFENTNNVLKSNNQLLYFDETTKINNRKYFILKANEYLDKFNPNNKGFVTIVSLKIESLNKTLGYEQTNNILLSIVKLMKDQFTNDSNIISRLNGSELVILTPLIDEKDLKDLVENFIKNVHDDLDEVKDKISIGIFKYDNNENIRTLLTKMDYAIAQAKSFNEKEYYFIEDINNYRTKEDWINIINLSLKEDYFELLYRNIIDMDSKTILHKTISFELIYKEDNISYKGFIAPILELNKLDEVYFHIIKKVLESKENINESVSIQLPTSFIVNLNNYARIKELFENHKFKSTEKIIFEIEEEAFRKNLANILIYIELFKKYGFGFAIFNFIANSDDYNYLIDLKPLYIKASKYFLLESKQSLNILKILTQSLDIKLIATSVDEIEELNLLSEVGIHAVCGPVMKNLPEEN